MIGSGRRSLILAAAVAALPMVATAASAQPFNPHARNDGVSVTITKGPTYLNTRTTPSGPTTQATYRTSALYQPFQQQVQSISFYRDALPRPFDIPGF